MGRRLTFLSHVNPAKDSVAARPPLSVNGEERPSDSGVVLVDDDLEAERVLADASLFWQPRLSLEDESVMNQKEPVWMQKDFAQIANDVISGAGLLQQGAPYAMKGFAALAKAALAANALDTRVKSCSLTSYDKNKEPD